MARKRPDEMETLEHALGADGAKELASSRPDIAEDVAAADMMLGELAALAQPADPPKRLLRAIEAEIDGGTARKKAKTMRADEGEWKQRSSKIWQKILFEDPETGRSIYLLRCQPGAVIPPHYHKHDEHVFMIECELTVTKQTIRPGDSQFSPAGSWHAMIRSPKGCLVMVQCL